MLLMRRRTAAFVIQGRIGSGIDEIPSTARSVFPLGAETGFGQVRDLAARTRSTCLFAGDPGQEGAPA